MGDKRSRLQKKFDVIEKAGGIKLPHLKYGSGISFTFWERNQATFSIWDSEKDINNFAYKNINHKNIIDKTRSQKWYKEDLFVRFHLLSDSGYIKS